MKKTEDPQLINLTFNRLSNNNIIVIFFGACYILSIILGRIKKNLGRPHINMLCECEVDLMDDWNSSLIIHMQKNSCGFSNKSFVVSYDTCRSYVIIKYFCRFPSELTLRNMWLQNMKALNWAPKETDSLCSKHFDTKCFITHNTRTTLKSGAVPTLFEGLFESK